MHKLPGRHRQQSGRTQVILGHRARWTDLCCHSKRSHSQRRVYGVYSGHNRIVRRRLTHTYTYSYGYGYADSDTYTNANADSYRNSYSHGHGHGHGYGHSHSHGDTHTDGNADSYS